jgi:hypothetical protein
MQDYVTVLTAYLRRFGSAPPSILTEDGATELMLRALARGRAIDILDLADPIFPPADVAVDRRRRAVVA